MAVPESIPELEQFIEMHHDYASAEEGLNFAGAIGISLFALGALVGYGAGESQPILTNYSGLTMNAGTLSLGLFVLGTPINQLVYRRRQSRWWADTVPEPERPTN